MDEAGAKEVAPITDEEKRAFERRHPNAEDPNMRRMRVTDPDAVPTYNPRNKPSKDKHISGNHLDKTDKKGRYVEHHLGRAGAPLPADIWGGGGGECGPWDKHVRLVYAGQGDPNNVNNGYNHWANTLNSYGNRMSQHLFNEGIRSSNWADIPRLKFLCLAPLKVVVNGTTDGRGVVTPAEIRQDVKAALRAERSSYGVSTWQPNAKAIVFFDGPRIECAPGALCAGQSELYQDNANAYYNSNWYGDGQPTPIVSRCGDTWNQFLYQCGTNWWATHVVTHEFGHSIGGVQPGTKQASNPCDWNEGTDGMQCTGNFNDWGHTNVGEDVLYDETINEQHLCEVPNDADIPFDCGYDSYFDTAQRGENDGGALWPSGPYLNLGSSQNPFFAWVAGNGAD